MLFYGIGINWVERRQAVSRAIPIGRLSHIALSHCF